MYATSKNLNFQNYLNNFSRFSERALTTRKFITAEKIIKEAKRLFVPFRACKFV